MVKLTAGTRMEFDYEQRPGSVDYPATPFQRIEFGSFDVNLYQARCHSQLGRIGIESCGCNGPHNVPQRLAGRVGSDHSEVTRLPPNILDLHVEKLGLSSLISHGAFVDHDIGKAVHDED